MKIGFALAAILLIATASASTQRWNPTSWVPTEYTQLLDDSSLTDWTQNYRIGQKDKHGFVGDTCNGHAVFGANVAGKNAAIRTDISLERGIYSYIIEATVWLVDSFDNENAIGTVNGDEVFNFNKHGSTGADYCGSITENYTDVSHKVELRENLTAQSFEFKVSTNTDEHAGNESIGLSEFRLWVAYCHPACHSCSGQGNGNCVECSAGYQKDDDDACIPADVGLTISVDEMDEFATKGTFSIGSNVYADDEDFPGETCGSHVVFGAGVASHKIEGKFSIPPRATHCAVQMDVWTIDTWDKETLSVTFEGQEVAQFAYDFDEEGQVANHCHQLNGDRRFRILSPMVAHPEDSEVSFRVTANLDSRASDESFGISNIKLFCEMCHPSCTECSHSNDRLGCSTCPAGQLLHVPRESLSGQCLWPTGACHRGFLNDNDVCEEECDVDSNEAHEGVSWMTSQDPEITATGERDYLHIVFSTDLPDTCYRGHLDIDASWDVADNIDTHMYPAEGQTKWRTDVYLMDSQLNDPEVCHTNADHANDTTHYTCDLEFIGKYNGSHVNSWYATFNLTFVDDHFTQVEIIKATVDQGASIGAGTEVPR